MRIIGIDNGNEMLETSEGIEFINKIKVGKTEMNKNDIKINYEGIDYTLGIDDGSSNISKNKHKKTAYKLSMLTGIAKSFDEENIECKAVVGTPVELFNDKIHVEDIKNQILSWGKQKINVNNIEKNVNILDVEIFPESGIVFADRERFKDEKTLVVDLGGSTVDISLWDGLRLENFKTYKHGMVSLYEDVIKEINNKKKVNLKPCEARFMIGKDFYIINQVKEDIRFIQPIVELYVNGLVSWINQAFDVDKVNSIQLIGGGAIMLEKLLTDEYRNAKLVKNAGFANANTYKKIGEAIWL